MTVTGTALRRIVVIAAVVLGLVAMHHLVATGCALATGHHGGTEIQTNHISGHPEGPGLPAHHLPAEPGVGNGSAAIVGFDALIEGEDANGGTASVIACVAVLVMLLILARCRGRSGAPQDLADQRQPESPALPSQVTRPPDLRALSISRT